jgi:hypothetical protein
MYCYLKVLEGVAEISALCFCIFSLELSSEFRFVFLLLKVLVSSKL